MDKLNNDMDWGAQVEVSSDSAGNGAELTLAAIKKVQAN